MQRPGGPRQGGRQEAPCEGACNCREEEEGQASCSQAACSQGPRAPCQAPCRRGTQEEGASLQGPQAQGTSLQGPQAPCRREAQGSQRRVKDTRSSEACCEGGQAQGGGCSPPCQGEGEGPKGQALQVQAQEERSEEARAITEEEQNQETSARTKALPASGAQVQAQGGSPRCQAVPEESQAVPEEEAQDQEEVAEEEAPRPQGKTCGCPAAQEASPSPPSPFASSPQASAS